MGTSPANLNPEWENPDQADYWFFLDPETGEDISTFSTDEMWNEDDDENFDYESAEQDILDDL